MRDFDVSKYLNRKGIFLSNYTLHPRNGEEVEVVGAPRTTSRWITVRFLDGTEIDVSPENIEPRGAK